MVEAAGATLEEALGNAVRALGEVVCGKPVRTRNETRRVKARGRDLEAMCHNFLEEVLYLADADDFAPAGIRAVAFAPSSIEAELFGGSISRSHRNANAVKAVTYNEFSVSQTPSGCLLRFVLDV